LSATVPRTELAKHGQRDEARAMLADIYKWFIEASTLPT
jgi:hypothetical protein